MARESSNLLKKDGSYSWSQEQKLREFFKSKKDELFTIPDSGARSNLIENDDFRIDCQGRFKVDGYADYEWINLQVQENRQRTKKGGKIESTTVLTTYVHADGYKRNDDPQISCHVIMRAMETQVWHAISEMTIFIQDRGKDGLVNNREPRSPHGILTYNHPKPSPFKIWKA